MTLASSPPNILALPRVNYAAQKFDQLQADLVSTARMWAVDEVGAAMAHQLNEPLTALLLYLHELQEESAQSGSTDGGPNSMREMVDKALDETKRVCDIMERVGHTFEAPIGAEIAVARGRAAIDSLINSSNANSSGSATPVSPRSGRHILTPREREVLNLIIDGTSNKEGGLRLGISTRTFEAHRAHIMEKLGAKNAADLVRMALSEAR